MNANTANTEQVSGPEKLPGLSRNGPLQNMTRTSKVSEKGHQCIISVALCDVIKMKFLKLWDLSGYAERAMSKRPTCQKMSMQGQIVSEIVDQLRLENSIQTLLNFLGSNPQKIRRVSMEFSEYNRLTSQRQLISEISFL